MSGRSATLDISELNDDTPQATPEEASGGGHIIRVSGNEEFFDPGDDINNQIDQPNEENNSDEPVENPPSPGSNQVNPGDVVMGPEDLEQQIDPDAVRITETKKGQVKAFFEGYGYLLTV